MHLSGCFIWWAHTLPHSTLSICFIYIYYNHVGDDTNSDTSTIYVVFLLFNFPIIKTLNDF